MLTFKKINHILISIPIGATLAAKDFYGKVLQLEEISGNHPGGALWYKTGDTELHLREESGHRSDSANHPAYEVADLKAARQFLQEQQLDITYSSEINGRDRCFFRDPWGNRFELIEFKMST